MGRTERGRALNSLLRRHGEDGGRTKTPKSEETAPRGPRNRFNGTGGGMGRGDRRRWAPGPRRGVWRPEADNPGPLKPVRAPGRQETPGTRRQDPPPTEGGTHPIPSHARGGAERARETEPGTKTAGGQGPPRGQPATAPRGQRSARRARAQPDGRTRPPSIDGPLRARKNTTRAGKRTNRAGGGQAIISPTPAKPGGPEGSPPYFPPLLIDFRLGPQGRRG